MMRLTFGQESTVELILPDGRVIRLAGGRPVAQPMAPGPPPSADRRRRHRPAFDALRGRTLDIRA
jgi:hypothetical protein